MLLGLRMLVLSGRGRRMLLGVVLRGGCGGLRRRSGPCRSLRASLIKRGRGGRERSAYPDPQSSGVVGCELPRRGQVPESRLKAPKGFDGSGALPVVGAPP